MTTSKPDSPASAPPDIPRRRGRLLQVLGVGFGLAVIIGNTIAAGIFRSPGQVASQLPDPWLFMAAWAVGGLYALLGALQIAELGAMLPRTGGQYAFSRHALGDYAGFVVGWSDWLSVCGTAAAVSLVIGELAGALMTPLAPYTPAIAVGIATLFATLLWRGIRQGSLLQNVTSLLKAVVFSVLIVAAFALGDTPSSEPAPVRALPTGIALATAFMFSLQAVIYTYDGWTGVVYFGEEVRDPGRAIPRSLLAGVTTVIVIYMLVNAALLSVLPVTRIAGEPFAAGAAATVIFGPQGEAFVQAIMLVSLLSAINANHLMAARVLFAMSRDGLVSHRAAAVNDGGTPTVALLLSAAVAVLFIVVGRTFEQVITVLAFFFIANYTLSFISLFVLRRREPARLRPYRAWGYPWTTALALAGSVAFLAGAIAGDTRNSIFALFLLAASYPVFRVIRLRE